MPKHKRVLIGRINGMAKMKKPVGSARPEGAHDDHYLLEKVQTSTGLISVEVVGDKTRPAIVTYHDLGLNGNSQFQGFFQFSEMCTVAERFCVYHINAPGQEDGAGRFDDSHVYPTVETLTSHISSVVEHFELKSFIGFGCGAGANLLIRFASKYPKLVDALILINASVGQAGWIEWGYQKVNSSYLRSRGMTTFTVDYLMWHHFGRNLDEYNQDMIDSYRHYFASITKPINLAGFIESWVGRSATSLSRTTGTLKCPVLQLVGGGSSWVHETVEVNSRLDPTKSEYIKISDACGLVLEDAPAKVTEAIILFLQGQGYFPQMYSKWQQKRRSVQHDSPPQLKTTTTAAAHEHDETKDSSASSSRRLTNDSMQSKPVVNT